MIIILPLASGSGWKPDIPVFTKQCSSAPDTFNKDAPKFTKAHGPLYKVALMRRLEEHRPERYVQLRDSRFRALQQLVSDYSDVLVIDGVLGGVIEGYECARSGKRTIPH